MKDLSNEKLEAQLTKYFHKVICNAASNYYRKRFRQKENEYLIENLLDYLVESASFEEDLLTGIMIENLPISIFDEILTDVIKQLNNREQQFIIEKFILEKTDEEIGVLFGVSRQAITNMKHRLYKKMRLC
ncbi:hypothetical protein QuyetLC_24490 [Bacillus anthracis]|uniref:Uncharacterized protein n=1 Tax=Bacillus anthracis TaxID=1392 RepID=A0A640MMT1_BACAN|nr:hypothetical protein QuyetLC_24490 [Bacillus anthracis]